MDCVDAGVYADGFFARGLDVLSAEYRGYVFLLFVILNCAFLTGTRYNGSTGKPSEAGVFMLLRHTSLLSIC